MVRSKVKNELIVDERAQRETFLKRKAGFLKKLSELKSLCNVDACAIIYNKNGGAPDVWPSSQEASSLLQRFQNLPIEMQNSSMMDQERFLVKSLEKMNKELEKEKKKTRRLEMEQFMNKCLIENKVPDVNDLEYLKDFLNLVHDKTVAVQQRISAINSSASTMADPGNKTNNGLENGDEKPSL